MCAALYGVDVAVLAPAFARRATAHGFHRIRELLLSGFEPVTRMPRKSDDSGREHHGFSWHAIDSTVLNDARLCIEASSKAGKTAVGWEGMREVDEGFWLPWKGPSTFNAGYRWFFR